MIHLTTLRVINPNYKVKNTFKYYAKKSFGFTLKTGRWEYIGAVVPIVTLANIHQRLCALDECKI